jgi:hypothetical protein
MAMLRMASVCGVMLLGLHLSAQGAPPNVVLPENGGVLESGNEGIRDGDWSTYCREMNSNRGDRQEAMIISFPEADIAYLNYRIEGQTYVYNGDAQAIIDVSLRRDADWTSVFHWQGHANTGYDTFWATNDNGGAGWQNVTGMRLYGDVWSNETSTAVVRFYEMAAFTPEPATLSLLALGGLAVLLRRRR